MDRRTFLTAAGAVGTTMLSSVPGWAQASAPRIGGFCDPRFAAVRAEFERNFRERGELGAAVTIHHQGRAVVDLWAGTADQASGRPWAENTMVTVFSATKGLAATCMHMLVDRGRLDIDAPVARYWPEFAANGKQDITVAMVLSHQAGLPYWVEPLPEGALYDTKLITDRLAAQAPIWEPGTTHGYHAITIGTMEAELVRRITGRTIGAFLRDQIARPLGADVWIGLPQAEEARVATVYLAAPDPKSPLARKLAAEPNWGGAKVFTNNGNDSTPANINSARRHAAEIPAAGGIVSARGLARVYAPLSLDGALGRVRLVGKARLPGMRNTRSASSRDQILQVPTTFTLGYSKSWGDRGAGERVTIGEHAFGTPGFGGSIGFADGDAEMAFGYVMNKHGVGTGLNERGQSLIDAAYRAVGFATSAPGFWVRG